MAFDFSPIDMEAWWSGLRFPLQDPGAKSNFAMTVPTQPLPLYLTLQDTMQLLSTRPAPVLKGRYTGASKCHASSCYQRARGPPRRH